MEEFLRFLQDSPTSWHAAEQAKKLVEKRGFHTLSEAHPWQIRAGGKYFVQRGGSFACFILPQQLEKMVLLAAHTDSPALKLKPHPLCYQYHTNLLAIETYGSCILHSWLNKDLYVAGRYVTSCLEEKLLTLPFLRLMIPELAIHLYKEVNEKGPLVNKQEHLLPILSCGEKIDFASLLPPEAISHDLFLIPAEPPCLIGIDQELIAAYRLDNLTSVHAALEAMTKHTPSPTTLSMALFFDHEEVGSCSYEGALSCFLQDLWTRICLSLSLSAEEFLRCKHHSFCLSLDMAHALHPLHNDKHDSNHMPYLGKGITLKHHAEMRYATSAKTAAIVQTIAKNAQVPLQNFAPRADMPCGTTVGPLLSRLGIPTADLGCPQLSMHSSRELASTLDYHFLCTFLQTALTGDL